MARQNIFSKIEEFNEYDEKAKSLPSATQDADKLVLYGLCKQATNGPPASFLVSALAA
ncbi:hypothetical protein LguiB_016477 [Lonicera macranthoides]